MIITPNIHNNNHIYVRYILPPLTFILHNFIIKGVPLKVTYQGTIKIVEPFIAGKTIQNIFQDGPFRSFYQTKLTYDQYIVIDINHEKFLQ